MGHGGFAAIVNQTDALLKTIGNLDRQPPADRDELDYAGRVFDSYASPAGRTPILSRDVLSEEDAILGYEPVPEGAEPRPGDTLRPAYSVLVNAPEFGGMNKFMSPVFQPGGEYSDKVAARLGGVQDPLAEAERLVGTLVHHADAEHNDLGVPVAENAQAALVQLRLDLQNAGGNADAKTAAIRTFANAMALAECGLLQNIAVSFQNNENHIPEPPPSAFATAITDILFDNFAALREALGIIDGVAMYNDAKNIVVNELHKPAGSAAHIIEAIKEDAQQAGGDKDYAIDIGV